MVKSKNIEARATKSLSDIENKLKKSFVKVRKEFEEHLDAINENSAEIESNYELLIKLESKIDKIENSLAEINRFMSQFKRQHLYFIDENDQNSFVIAPLSDDEKRVFKAIYDLEIEGASVTYQKVADVIGVSLSLVREYLIGLIEKGVPITKKYLNQQVYLGLEPKFRMIQTKQNIIEF